MASTRSARIVAICVMAVSGCLATACGSQPSPSNSETPVRSPCATWSLIAEEGAAIDMSGVDGSLASWLGVSTSVVQGTVTDAKIEFIPIETDEAQEPVRSRSTLKLDEQRVLWTNPWAEQVEEVSDQAVSYLGPAGYEQKLAEAKVICVGDSVLVFVAGTLSDRPGEVQAFAVVPIADAKVGVYPVPGVGSIPEELAAIPTKDLTGVFEEAAQDTSPLLRDVINYPMSERAEQIFEREWANNVEDSPQPWSRR